MGKWKNCTIADIGTVVGGATPSTKHAENYMGGTIAWITPKDLSDFHGRFISKGERNITKAGLEGCSAQLLPANTVLFSSRAPIGYIAIAENEVCTNQGFKSVVPNSSTDSLFLYYLLKYNKDTIEAMGSGTTFKEVSGSTMKQIPIRIPEDIDEQKKIGQLLGCLDDKIEENEHINQNLEEQMQSLFNKMFSAKIANVEAYRNLPLGELVLSIDNRGKTPPLEPTATAYPIIDVKALSGGSRIINFDNCSKFVSAETYDTWFRSGHPKPKDILISTVGSVAEMKLFFGSKGCIAQNVVGFRSKNISAYYLYQYLVTIKNDLAAYNIGSVQPSIKVTHIIKHPIYIPSQEELNEFESFSSTMTDSIYQNRKESENLMILRDTLLPKLMSGELDVSDIDI